MQRPQILIALLISGLSIVAELRSIKENAVFFGWTNSAPIPIICITASIFLVLNIKQYIIHKQLTYFAPIFVCIIALAIMISHKKRRYDLDTSATCFTANTMQIGGDGGFRFDFKKNGHLVADRGDHWKHTRYWGNYSRKNDTIMLDISLNFKLGRQAILTDTSLNFIDDTIKFNAYKWQLQSISGSSPDF